MAHDFPAIRLGPNRNDDILRRQHGFCCLPLNQRLKLQYCFLWLAHADLSNVSIGCWDKAVDRQTLNWRRPLELQSPLAKEETRARLRLASTPASPQKRLLESWSSAPPARSTLRISCSHAERASWTFFMSIGTRRPRITTAPGSDAVFVASLTGRPNPRAVTCIPVSRRTDH